MNIEDIERLARLIDSVTDTELKRLLLQLLNGEIAKNSFINPAQLAPSTQRGCKVCGIGADGQVWGYVCPRNDCPTRITCG